MGTLLGHVAPGFAFLALGLWHLFNHIKLFCLHPTTYTSSPWFPTSKLRHMELFLIMFSSSSSISMELFISPKHHHPFDPQDGTIPSNHLHNFEHTSISLTFFTYAVFAILFDKTRPSAHYGLTNLIGAIAFAQQLFLFYFHSADHMGVEGQYHLLLQLVIFVSLATTLLGIGMPKSFLVSFVRSLSIALQGMWLILMGYMLWMPSLIPNGCFLHREVGHKVVRCSSDQALHRAKSLVNITFSWILMGITIFAMLFYLFLHRICGRAIDYSKSDKKDFEGTNMEMVEYHHLESHKGGKQIDESRYFISMGEAITPIEMES